MDDRCEGSMRSFCCGTVCWLRVAQYDDSNSTSSNPAPPLQNHMFSLEKRGFRDDSGDSLGDSPGAKAAHKTTQHLQAWTCMDRQERQSNWPNMRKTLGKPGFLSGEDRNRTFACFPCVFERVREVPDGCCRTRLYRSHPTELVDAGLAFTASPPIPSTRWFDDGTSGSRFGIRTTLRPESIWRRRSSSPIR